MGLIRMSNENMTLNRESHIARLREIEAIEKAMDLSNEFSLEEFLIGVSGEIIEKVRQSYMNFVREANELTNGSSNENNAARVLFNIIKRNSKSEDKGLNEASSYFGIKNLSKQRFSSICNYASLLIETSLKVKASSATETEYSIDLNCSSEKVIGAHDLFDNSRFIFMLELSKPSTSSNSMQVKNDNVAQIQWLHDLCSEFCKVNSHTIFDSITLSTEIVNVYRSAVSSSLSKDSILENFQSRLFELIGDTGFELMIEICGNVSKLDYINPIDLKSFTSRDTKSKDTSRSNINTELNHKNNQANSSTLSSSFLTSLGFSQEYVDQEKSLGLKGGPRVQEIKDTLSIYNGGLEYHEKRGLPEGSKRVLRDGYEEISIPAPKKSNKVAQSDLVLIESLESWAQSAFANTKSLNVIQSAVFQSAYHSSENILVCAPTGAGKTNIAMLTFLQLLKLHISGGVLDKHSVKAVYVAPMKALAQEVVAKFSERLKALGLVVREFTGDMQLTRNEVLESNLLVTTPEKYDVVTRKGGDGSLGTLVGLIIIDEVHLLADDRGAVIETIVSRTQRYVESSQKLVRLVGLSATLPNYKDVAMFLGVNLRTGLHYFGPEYRPVPLDQTFIGVTEKQRVKRNDSMNKIAYEHVIRELERGKQVMIFVHSRKETSSTADAIINLAQRAGTLGLFENVHHEKFTLFQRDVDKSRNKELQQLFYQGVGIHHAGMLRSDRTLTELMFDQGLIKVLCCTATLAWGVNLPAHTVIIKGTELYDPERGGFVDLSILDVFQIFGRAGRPQYDTSGHAVLITPHKSLGKYISLLGEQNPIESGFIKSLHDHMNAEIVNGTINNIKEAVQWLSYTFLYIRMCKNPTAYGITLEERMEDVRLQEKRLRLIKEAAEKLDRCRMIRYDSRSGNLAVTDLGRIASHYYIKCTTIDLFNNMLLPHLQDMEALQVLCSSAEFEQLKVRPEEIPEIDALKKSLDNGYSSWKGMKGGIEETSGKVCVLLQSYLNCQHVQSFTLQSDTNYITTNASRISRALFEICLKRGWATLTHHYLSISKAIDRRMDTLQHPLRQFNELPQEVVKRLEDMSVTIDEILSMQKSELGQLIHNQKHASKVLFLAECFPKLQLDASIQPITRNILRIVLTVSCQFKWQDKYHGSNENFWIWIEDGENEVIYHAESFSLAKKSIHELSQIEIMIPIRDPLPPQYFIRVVSDRWVGCQNLIPMSFQHLLLPDRMPPHSDLLDIHPVPREALCNKKFESMYKFSHFNPIQSQVFHVLYHTDFNVLVGAPTGSGKTIIGEIALLRLFNQRKGKKAIYVAPLKALARERLLDWQNKLGRNGLGYHIEELTGDVTPDLQALKKSDLLIVTPEKWDSISRGWQRRSYVSDVELVIIDEIHLLGVDRGPVLEVIVSRMRFISAQKNHPIRFIGLSTALANPRDLADWLGIENIGVYNFRPSVRPIPMTIHISGFPGKHYCPRMATMNKPCYSAILEHSPKKPALIFVSSRRQTRLTALDLISYCASDDYPKQFLHMSEEEVVNIALTIKDKALQDAIVFGVGIHHAGLDNHDRSVVEKLFLDGKIQVLVCTSTLAWGVNLPCHLVIVKGTEYFDGKSHRYVDMPVTDVLQMIGRAGRPQFDDTGVACVFVHEPKKNFYRKFLHDPFPVESSLHLQLHNHINAEIATGTLLQKKDCFEYLAWTYCFRRLIMNPSYYQLHDTTSSGLEKFIDELISNVLIDLQKSGCIKVEEDCKGISKLFPTMQGKIVSYYYLDYRTSTYFANTLQQYQHNISKDIFSVEQRLAILTNILCNAMEFSELPVRHNEEILNEKLSRSLPWKVSNGETLGVTIDHEKSLDMQESVSLEVFAKPQTKAFLLIQAYVNSVALPISDYVNDLKSVLDQVPRVLNAMIDLAADAGFLESTLDLMKVSQMIIQGIPYSYSPDNSSWNQIGLKTLQNKNQHKINLLQSLTKSKSEVSKWLSIVSPSNEELQKRILARWESLPLFSLKVLGFSSMTELKSPHPIEVTSTEADGDSLLCQDALYEMKVSLQILRGRTEKAITSHERANQKSISIWVVLSHLEDLLAIKRLGNIERDNIISLQFSTPRCSLTESFDMKVHVVSDSYMCLEQVVSYRMTVKGSSDVKT